VGFVGRLSPDRSFVPKEGFGFGLQVGAVLGEGTLRLALGLSYAFGRFAREKTLEIGGTNLTSCSDVRSISHHLVMASALGWAEFGAFALSLGVSGGMAYAQLETPHTTADDQCDVTEGDAFTGVIGPELDLAYRLRPDLWIGLYLRYHHFFTKRRWESPDGTLDPRYFHPVLATGLQITLRF
jgi:hypothetical protein